MKIKDAIANEPLCRHLETCDDLDTVVITSEQIRQTIDGLAGQIQAAYADHTTVVILFLLEGARQFARDLEESLDEAKFEFVPVKASSYCGGTRSTGEIAISLDDMPDITGQTVLILDDMYDSGLTLTRVKSHLETRGAATVKTCVMFEKDCQHAHKVALDFVGLPVPNKFLVGYGLDYQERYRELRCVGTLKPDLIDSKSHHEDPQPFS